MRVYVQAQPIPDAGDAVRYDVIDEAGQPVQSDVGVGVSDLGFGPFIPEALAPIAAEAQAATVELEPSPAVEALERIDEVLDAAKAAKAEAATVLYAKAQAIAARETVRARWAASMPQPRQPLPELEALLTEVWRSVDRATGSTATADQVVGDLRSRLER